MIILRSTGPVISTRRSRRSAGRGATVHRSFADLACRGEEVGLLAGVERGLAGDAGGEELLAAAIELALEADDEGEGFGGENAVVAVGGGGVDGGAGWEGHGRSLMLLR